eukprot:724656-Prymnesium_polylepis.1
MVTCTCPSRGQSSEAIIYAVSKFIYAVALTVPEREHRRNQTAKRMIGYYDAPEREVAPPQSNRERNDCFF